MRRLDWVLASVIGLFLLVAVVMQTGSMIEGAVRSARPDGGALAQTVAADIVRLPVARQFVARYHALMPAR
jgi:hypothetical protein